MAPTFALKFISGKYQGGEFPLVPDRDVVVGRASDLDMVLVEDMVSRKHAKISTQNGDIIIQDLGSTNGTFVNGEKIKKTRLKEGDRILIGTSILKVAKAAKPADRAAQDKAKARLEAIEHESSGQRPPADITGQVEEVPVPDLLQLFGTSKRTGVLKIRTDTNVGKIYLRDGNTFYAVVGDDHHLGPMKSFVRIVGWKEGQFEFTPPEKNQQFTMELEDSTESLVAEALRQLAEFALIQAELPVGDAILSLAHPLEPLLSALSPLELDVLQLALNHGAAGGILERSVHTDFQTAQALLRLLAQGYLVADK